MSEELRCYTFGDFMLSSMQQGIQSGHAAMELVNKYMIVEGWQNGHAEFVASWVRDYKTILVMNGGDYAGVCEWLEFLSSEDNPFPFAGFVEEECQGGNLTAVSVILPARIFEGAERLRKQKYDPQISVVWDHLMEELRVSWVEDDEAHSDTFNVFERDLMNRLNTVRFAQ